MNKIARRPLRRFQMTVCALGAAAALLGGCRLPSSELELVSYKDPYFPEPYHAAFENCFYRIDPSGDYQIVGKSVRPSEEPDRGPITQYIHIHMFWKPWPGKTFSNPTTIDATLRYVIATDSGVVEYVGTGFVYPKRDRLSGKLIAKIEGARLRLVAQEGNPAELLGDARITGNLIAERDPSRTTDLRREMDFHAGGNGLP